MPPLSMHPTVPTLLPSLDDAQLWLATQAGDRDAFARIVERYQTLICSIAYSRSGDLATAADFAQETFLTAWRQAAELREPARLRAWLCGIARNLTASAARRDRRRGGSPAALEDIAEPTATAVDPESSAVSREEEALLWQALSRLPETYREPLVLFYREEQSLAEVAAQLDLSQDAVKQRLSRGRAKLRDEMEALVESALVRSRPDARFTAAVLAAVAVTAPASAVLAAGSAGVAGAASAAGKGFTAAAVAGPAAGLLTAWLASRLAGANARSLPERAVIQRAFRHAMLFVLPMIALVLGLVYVGTHALRENPWFLALGATAWTVALVGGLMGISRRVERQITRLRRETGTEDAAYGEVLARRGLSLGGSKRWQSKTRLFGLPLVALAFGGLDPGAARGRGARGWIAVGDLAVSPFFAFGGVAVAPIALGGVTVGLLSLSLAGVAVGALALGSIAFGAVALGIVAVGWKGAAGVTAIAHDSALGNQARAGEANSQAARDWFTQQWFTEPSQVFFALLPLVILLAIVVPLSLMAWRAWRLRRSAPASMSAPVAPAATSDQRDDAAIPAPERLHALDALRGFALLLGVLLHASMHHVLPPGIWAVGTLQPVPLLGWLAYAIHSFRMELFFLLAGFFGAVVVSKRGVGAYLQDRGTRIVLVFLLALYPMKLALAAIWIRGGLTTGWLKLPEALAALPLSRLALGGILRESFPDLALTHLWFLYVLAIVTGLFLSARALVRRFVPAAILEAPQRLLAAVGASLAAPLALALVVTPLLAGMKGMDIDTPDQSLRWNLPVLALDGLFFALGWGLHARRELLETFAARWKSLLLGGLALSLVGSALVGMRYAGGAWVTTNALAVRWGSSLVTALTMSSFCLGWLGVFHRFCQAPRPSVRRLADASYWIYLAHLPIVAGLQVLAAGRGLPWWIEVPAISVVTVLALLVIDRVAIRGTCIGAWLNGRRR